MESNFVPAYKLRDKDELKKIPNDKPGYYKWWADRDTLQIILDKLNMQFDGIKNYLEVKNGYYCIYVGVAIKESLQARLNWHINQINKPTNVKSGTLSTLRKTISSLVGKNMLDTDATNDFINKLLVEYYLFDDSIKSQTAKDKIHKIENDLLNCDTLYILNIQDNHHKLSPKKELKKLRKIARQI